MKNKKTILTSLLLIALATATYFILFHKVQISCETLLWARFPNEEMKLEQELWEPAKDKCAVRNLIEMAKKHCEAFKANPDFLGISAYMQVREGNVYGYRISLNEANACDERRERRAIAEPNYKKDKAWQQVFDTKFPYKNPPQAKLQDRSYNIQGYSLKPEGHIEQGQLFIDIFNTGWVFLSNPKKNISRYVYIPDIQWNTSPLAQVFDDSSVVIYTRFGQFYIFDEHLSLVHYWATHTKVCGDASVDNGVMAICLTDLREQTNYEVKVNLRSGDLFGAKELPTH
ncbi:hypothetical protein [Bdellovibrio sp. NC01]|uniref:hypothetical protein n=1 Tax=Bdellovibrio sp. NC01 TaxID=2220073 RepID=UPI00115AFC03|nr:hypothetical protein [Bdellovibrio sp. NC01]